jgi:hypothetical protein
MRKTKSARMLVVATGLAAALSGALLAGVGGPAVADVGAAASCGNTKSTSSIGGTLTSKTLGDVTSYVKTGSIEGVPYVWGRVAGEVSTINYVIFEVDTGRDGFVDCYLRKAVGTAAINTSAQPRVQGWSYRTCWAVTDRTSCTGLNSTTSWTS